MTGDGTVLDRRALNRALLARQMLLRRERMPALDAVERLAGMQSQAPNPPYLGLWTRLEDFDFAEVARLMHDRRAVRMVLMRGTIHLVSVRDALAWRPHTQPLLDAWATSTVLATLPDGVGVADIAEAARPLLEEAPLSDKELRTALAERWPDVPGDLLIRAVRSGLALVQVPPRGIWGASGLARHTTVEQWLGRSVEPCAAEEMLTRYLAAFGPATVRDAQHWWGVTRLGEVMERLAPGLVTFTDEHGRVLYDLPDAPRPGPDAPAPVRYVPEFDNLTLSHADRARIVSEEHRKRIFTVNGIIRATVLVDGFVHGMWKIERKRKEATLRVELFGPVSAADRKALLEEGERLLTDAHPEATTRTVDLV
ncbi:winged helix DNA-binding domain-containing protein [Actinomadura hibisca]|uniref:winged helix DNA-binding domain-containing protein n=1 Tax=Actinomadura hibisca TaxID=68565 RepID=UPI00082AB03E|nr:winged helix DNA-binding domain-containing protein [Actinomadura hibisca]